MSRQYFREHATVLSYNSMTSMLMDLGSGTIEVTAAEAENSTLKDEWTDQIATKKTATFEGEMASDTAGPNWFSEVGGSGQLIFTCASGTVSGIFACYKATQQLDDAMRWSVSLKSRGPVTIS